MSQNKLDINSLVKSAQKYKDMAKQMRENLAISLGKNAVLSTLSIESCVDIPGGKAPFNLYHWLDDSI